MVSVSDQAMTTNQSVFDQWLSRTVSNSEQNNTVVILLCPSGHVVNGSSQLGQIMLTAPIQR